MGSSNPVFACIAILFSLITVAPAVAANRTWVGRSFFNDNWGDSANWDLFAWPDHGDTPLFTIHGGSRTTPFVDYGVTLAGIRFIDIAPELPAPVYTINGTDRILTMTGAISVEGRNQQRVNARVKVGAGTRFRNDSAIGNSALLTIGGPVDTFGNRLFVHAGASGIDITGVISGGGSLEKQSSGKLTLTANNTYSGDTIIGNGTLRLSGNGRLSAATLVQVSPGAVLEMFGITQAIDSLFGAGRVDGGHLIVGTTGADNGNGSYSGVLDTDSLTKRGTGTLSLQGVSNYGGPTNIEQGALHLQGAGRLRDLTPLSINAAGTLRLESNVDQSVRTLNGAGKIELEAGSRLTVWFAGGSFSGNISGAGGLSQSGGTLVLSGVNSYSGSTLVEGGTLDVRPTGISASSPVIVNGGVYLMSGPAATYAPKSLQVSLGTARLAAGANKLLRTTNVTTTGDGKLDLADNDMILTAGSLETITTLIATARNAGPSGLWSGPGITSSTAAARGHTLGAILNDNGAGQPLYPSFHGATGLSATDIIVATTVPGDLNLDGTVSIADFIDLAAHFGQTGATWASGDINYDRTVSISDFIDLAANFGVTYSGSSLSQPQFHSVPEPSMMLTAAMALTVTLVRRRCIWKTENAT